METRYIYKIQNNINNKVYIGQTINFKRRIKRHFCELRNNKHHNYKLQSDFNIYGEKNFIFKIVFEEENCSQERIDKMEIEYIKKYNSFKNGYNLNEGGQFCGNNGYSGSFTKEQIFNILSMIEFHDSKSGGILSRYYNVSLTTIYRISNGLSYLDFKKSYETLSYEEKFQIYINFKSKIKEPLHRTVKTRVDYPEEMFYLIYIYQEYGNNKRCFLQRDFKIKNSNVLQLIRQKKTYKDYWEKYQTFSLDKKIEILCHYMETYNRKPPELLEHLFNKRQSAAKLRK